MQQIIELIKTNLLPEGRAIATAASFELMFKNTPSITVDRFLNAMMSLSIQKEANEPINVTARRTTCGEIANLMPFNASNDLDVVWEEWVNFLQTELELVPPEQVGRYSAMLTTAIRELNELRVN